MATPLVVRIHRTITQRPGALEPALAWTAAGGTIGPFRYAVLYNDTPTSPADPLVGWWDYASNLTLQIGESFKVDFGASMFTIG
jgi:hypothetical protein